MTDTVIELTDKFGDTLTVTASDEGWEDTTFTLIIDEDARRSMVDLTGDGVIRLIGALTRAAEAAGAAIMPPAKPRKAPKGPQEYRGNGRHTWEGVGAGKTMRLRVPGGWLYRDGGDASSTFVPMPDVVGYVV
jgi:hypothetical protein